MLKLITRSAIVNLYLGPFNKYRHVKRLKPGLRSLASFALSVPFIGSSTDKLSIFSCILKEDITNIKLILARNKELVNRRHPLGWTPLMLAVVQNNYEIAKYLIELGAVVNATDLFSGIEDMAHRKNQTIASVREERVVNFSPYLNEFFNYCGSTPLHYAVLVGDSRMVNLLLDNGSDPKMKNSQGYTPLDLVGNSKEIQQALKDALLTKEINDKKIEIKKKLNDKSLEEYFQEKMVGQKNAICTISSIIRRKINGWYDSETPLVLLFLGSSGIGKTEMAKQMAEFLHGNKPGSFIRFDMSEFQQEHQAAKFIGSPPGYLGHEEGGQLTKALQKCPNAVVLFDETEKAHPDVLATLLQLFDEGRITDGKGVTTICKNAIFIMTSNVGSKEIAKESQKNNQEEFSTLFKENIMRPLLRRAFVRDEFLGRVNEFVYFVPFNQQELFKLVEVNLNSWSKKAITKRKINVTWDKNVIETIIKDYDLFYGARSIKYSIERNIINLIALADEKESLSPYSTIDLKVDLEKSNEIYAEIMDGKTKKKYILYKK